MKPEDLFGQPVLIYTRADALRDKVLLDISSTAWECANLPLHTVITQGLWQTIAGGDPFDARDQRIRDLCYALMFAAAGLKPGQWCHDGDGGEFQFTIKLENQKLPVRMIVGPGDQGELVATLLLLRES